MHVQIAKIGIALWVRWWALRYWRAWSRERHDFVVAGHDGNGGPVILLRRLAFFTLRVVTRAGSNRDNYKSHQHAPFTVGMLPVEVLPTGHCV